MNPSHQPPAARKAAKPRTPKQVAQSPFNDPAKARAAGAKGKAGRREGSKNVVSEAKIRFLAQTGQTPLEFLTAVFRNQLYSEYEVEVIDEKRGLAKCHPKLHPVTGELDCEHIPVELEKRIAAATAAAPYVHRKMPIGIDGGAEGKPIALVSADRLAELSDEQLAKLLEVLGTLGIGAEFAGAAPRVPTLGEGEGV